ncbi:hypothetical protein G6F50_015063 [Rhizopus delemar]|uniref:Uncharacterized protein n=1 Tax=Rhizopus delemar TaxID=936053 RepID=A0A9P6Y089_9FUNG|nr:hypothetical protein G6F50_015063 [Rhizopus delemar]
MARPPSGAGHASSGTWRTARSARRPRLPPTVSRPLPHVERHRILHLVLGEGGDGGQQQQAAVAVVAAGDDEARRLGFDLELLGDRGVDGRGRELLVDLGNAVAEVVFDQAQQRDTRLDLDAHVRVFGVGVDQRAGRGGVLVVQGLDGVDMQPGFLGRAAQRFRQPLGQLDGDRGIARCAA